MNNVEHLTLGTGILLLILILPVFVYIALAKRGMRLFVRRLAAIDAIDEAVGRSAELGRPTAFTSGLTPISPTLYAVLGVLYYVGRRTAQYKNGLLLPQCNPEVMAIVEDTVRDAYRDEDRSNLFDPKSVRFLSDEQFAFAAGYMGLVQREKVASAFLLGYFAAESLLLAEAGQEIGAMQVAGSISPEQVPFFICTCDYTLIGEEIYAASAYLTEEPIQLGSLYAQDRAKFVFFLLICVGVAMATIESITPGSVTFSLQELLLREFW